jgi:hypothetical protein
VLLRGWTCERVEDEKEEEKEDEDPPSLRSFGEACEGEMKMRERPPMQVFDLRRCCRYVRAAQPRLMRNHDRRNGRSETDAARSAVLAERLKGPRLCRREESARANQKQN